MDHFSYPYLNQFPDGTPMSDWFRDLHIPPLSHLGPQYRLDDFGILQNGSVQTAQIQAVIDRAAALGGGVIVVPAGLYLSGALYFRQGTHLHIEHGGVLMGSDRLADYPVCMTRIEGQNGLYFPALINVDHVNGFTMTGEGIIDGNGMRFWEDFLLRRQWNPACTNKDSQRPRLVYFSHCSNVLVSGLTLQNSALWTNHLYKCDHVRYLRCRILSPHEPVPACSTDAIDIDASSDILIKNCYMEVNDDAVALKGGKGVWADTLPENGSNERILIEDCEYGFCHGCLTLGSESIHNRNIILRNITVSSGYNLLWLKLRPDTPQIYEYIRLENIRGKIANVLNIHPWSQFYTPGNRSLPPSRCTQISFRDCVCACDVFFNVQPDEAHYRLSDFRFQNLQITATDTHYDPSAIWNCTFEQVFLSSRDSIDFPDSVTTLTADNTILHGYSG